MVTTVIATSLGYVVGIQHGVNLADKAPYMVTQQTP